MRILVVEDEPRMAALMRQGLEEEAYAVDVVGNGLEVIEWLQSAEYDIVLLDIMLPGMDGIDVCKQLRAKGFAMPVLMLTARLRAVGRREGPSKTPELVVGDLVLDTTTKRTHRGDMLIDLTAKEYALLETLMRHPNQVLSRDQIIEHVWDMDFEAESK